MAADPRMARSRWLGLVPIAGCGAFAASTLTIYVRDVAAQAGCAGSFVCGDFSADPRALVAAVAFAAFGLALLVGTASAPVGVSRPRLAPILALGVAASFALLVAIISLNGAGAGVYEIVPIAIWVFLGVGYLALWTLTTFRVSLVGAWRLPAQALALVHGAVAIAATLVTLAIALGPGPMFL